MRAATDNICHSGNGFDWARMRIGVVVDDIVVVVVVAVEQRA